jgi:hypothetical protein
MSIKVIQNGEAVPVAGQNVSPAQKESAGKIYGLSSSAEWTNTNYAAWSPNFEITFSSPVPPGIYAVRQNVYDRSGTRSYHISMVTLPEYSSNRIGDVIYTSVTSETAGCEQITDVIKTTTVLTKAVIRLYSSILPQGISEVLPCSMAATVTLEKLD